MSKKTPDKFSLHVPDEKEPARALPSKLEVINYNPRTKQPQANLPAGAYNPYDRERSDGEQSKEKRKQVDLRRLSKWIEATQKVKILKMEDMKGMRDPDAGATQTKLPKLK
jgi:hypothetical protein